MKKIILFITVINLLSNCSPSKKNQLEIINKDEKVNKKKSTNHNNSILSVEEKEKNIQEIKRIQKETRNLYYELLKFKNNADFRHYGFSVNYRYSNWLTKIEKLKASTSTPLIMIDYLKSLGLTYVTTKGEETEFTLGMKETIEILFNYK